jgi:hypothetical protein
MAHNTERYGTKELQVERWQRVVEILDERVVGWRKDNDGYDFLGDDAASAIIRLVDENPALRREALVDKRSKLEAKFAEELAEIDAQLDKLSKGS